MPDDLLAQGIAAVKARNIQQARQLLDAAIRASPNDELTWGWFYNVCKNDEERLRCLREVLRINPSNEIARRKYNELVALSLQSPPAAPTIKNQVNLSRFQKLVLGGLALILIVALVGVGVIIWPDISRIIFPPTESPIVMSASSTDPPLPVASPTERPIPTTRIQKPTWTPLPTITPWSILTRIATVTALSTPTPQKLSTPTPKKVVATSPPIVVKPDCSAQYDYIEAVHQYNLNYLNAYYDQVLSSYQSLLEQALRDRDARRVLQLQQQIEQLKAQRDAAINTENARYEADRAYLDAQCK